MTQIEQIYADLSSHPLILSSPHPHCFLLSAFSFIAPNIHCRYNDPVKVVVFQGAVIRNHTQQHLIFFVINLSSKQFGKPVFIFIVPFVVLGECALRVIISSNLRRTFIGSCRNFCYIRCSLGLETVALDRPKR